MDLDRLLNFGFFPKELPPPFSTLTFGGYIAAEGGPDLDPKYQSKPCLHNLARPGNQRRVLSIPNALNYYYVAKILSDNSTEIQQLLTRSKLSVSKPIVSESDFRAFIPEFDGRDLYKRKLKFRALGKYILRADISRFYHSIYTHSLPWAILGKAHAKANRKGGFANDLDRYLMNSQDGQTLGIPVGPDTSLIVSEIVASAIDEKLQHLKVKGTRFVDDFEFIFLKQNKAERCLSEIESVLHEFELALNPLKSFVEELPIAVDNRWRWEIRRFNFSDRVSDNEIAEYFDLLFYLYNANKGEPVLRYGIARLKSVKFRSTKVLANLLIQSVLAESGTLKEVLYLVDKMGIPISDKKLRNLIVKVINVHVPLKHGSEVAWALWAAIRHEIDIDSAEVSRLAMYDDSIVALLALDLNQRGLLDGLELDYFKSLMNPNSLLDGHWLLAYEANIKGWLPPATKKDYIENDTFFSKLKENGVFFYDDNLTDDLEDEEESGYDSIEDTDDGEEDEDDTTNNVSEEPESNSDTPGKPTTDDLKKLFGI